MLGAKKDKGIVVTREQSVKDYFVDNHSVRWTEAGG
jgi:hypothetical protein